MKLRIMVVDDSAVMRLIIAKNLRQAGFTVEKMVEAANGEEALQKFDPKEIDVVFSDLHMPGMDGYEFARRLRQLSPTVPILLITAEASTAKLQEAMAAGANDYLSKPPIQAELKAKLAPFFEH